jgi:plastocyanin
VLLTAAGGVAGFGPLLLAAQPAWAFMSPVKIDGRAFYSNDGATPAFTRINVGDKVFWKNGTDEAHSVTFDDPGSFKFDETLGRQGATAEARFDNQGTYTYHCKFHKGMTGTVEVNDPNAPRSTTTTAPPSTTTTARPTTTTAPPTTTTTEAPTTTTAPPRPPAEVPAPPVPNSAAASTTTAPPTTTTTAPPTTTTSAPATTVTSAAPSITEPASSSSTSATASPTTDGSKPGGTGDEVETAAGRPASPDGGLDAGAMFLIGLLVAVGLFGTWTLFRVRPGRI